MVGGRAVPTPLPCRSAPLRNFAQDLFVCPYPSSITGFRPANQHLHAASPSPAELVCKSLRNHPALEEGLNTRLFNKMRRSLSFPTGFLHALSCCQSPRVVSGPGSPWADRFPKSPPCAVSTVSGTANTSCSSWRRRKPRSEQSLASCCWVFSSKTSSVSQVTWRIPCASVFGRKMGLIPFTCLLQSWLRCLIHVSGLAGDCGMNDAI